MVGFGHEKKIKEKEKKKPRKPKTQFICMLIMLVFTHAMKLV